jgi:hypothetical protein
MPCFRPPVAFSQILFRIWLLRHLFTSSLGEVSQNSTPFQLPVPWNTSLPAVFSQILLVAFSQILFKALASSVCSYLESSQGVSHPNNSFRHPLPVKYLASRFPLSLLSFLTLYSRIPAAASFHIGGFSFRHSERGSGVSGSYSETRRSARCTRFARFCY